VTSKGQGGYVVFIARSTGHAYQIEKVLAKKSVPCKLIPVPRNISSDCGMCVRVERSFLESAVTILKDERVDVESVHEV